MKKIIITVFVLISIIVELRSESVMDTVTIEIQDSELNSLYYHQDSFEMPTRLIFPNLTTVTGIAYFHQNGNLLSIDLPKLNYIGDNMYFHGNKEIESINVPSLETIHNSLYISQNTNLKELNICSLKYILPSEDDDQIPSYYIQNNNTVIDQQPFCFSLGAPENLSISNSLITENSPPLSFIGKLSADGNYPVNSFTYYLPDHYYDNEYFTIRNDSLFSNVTFDFEINESYEITVGVYNQLAETVINNFTINVENIINEDIKTIEILDDTLSSLYYHQENFTEQTKLIFPNLTTVTGIAYFHQNVNLISVDLPKLNYIGDYMYFHGNEVIETINAPALETIHNSLYISQNTNLKELNICSLKYILPSEGEDRIPSYYIQNNNPITDQQPFCFSLGAPENLSLSNTLITENSPPLSFIGKLSADGNYPVNSFTYYLPDHYYDNDYFMIRNDSLFSNATFDFEVIENYEITVGVYNQLAENVTNGFTINVENVINENVQTIEILDDTLSSLYYHQENFTEQTKLIFPNLTTVTGIAYFHQNVNLISVDLPKLNYVGDYMYFHGNEVIETINAPVLDTIHNYLYVSQNTNLTELDICSLTHIISTDQDRESYYYVKNNPLLNFTSTCLDSTILEFVAEDSLVVSSRILVGNFQSNTLDSITHYINDSGINVSETENFIIEESSLYLKKEIAAYTEDSYPLLINSFRMDQNANTILNEQIELTIDLKIKDKSIITSSKELATLNEIKCYPNPTNSILYLEIDLPGNYKLFDLEGNLIEVFTFTRGINQVDLSKLSTNLYFLYSEFGHNIKIGKQ